MATWAEGIAEAEEEIRQASAAVTDRIMRIADPGDRLRAALEEARKYGGRGEHLVFSAADLARLVPSFANAQGWEPLPRIVPRWRVEAERMAQLDAARAAEKAAFAADPPMDTVRRIRNALGVPTK